LQGAATNSLQGAATNSLQGAATNSLQGAAAREIRRCNCKQSTYHLRHASEMDRTQALVAFPTFVWFMARMLHVIPFLGA